ncbi:Formate/nitrite transporter FocA, FNT family [Bifidobacterium bohemicum]|uniref:Formate/nitrite transporter n=1 Tax=Bifidobacterium bohemicum DSM 22767 TaxID=1437606 RepID=A0A086ZFX4_9BIFI|nr:formate/nitrite transporter family protein [Bifidobacterium bohemicum]KFI45424.1 formate/nitrite transporter [Bifidobacterium bohemicum DSM 22767]SCB73204.1 Formate/nitrite transporter FocA, FNT family [Bifidobacterium bohemicum]
MHDPTPPNPIAHRQPQDNAEQTNPLFPGRAFISTVLDALESKETMTGTMTGRYIQRAVMAGLFVGIFFAAFWVIIGQASMGGPGLRLAGKVIAGITFGWALVLIYYTNSELLTSNMMVVSVGAYHKRIGWAHSLKLLGLCLVGNLLGALVVAIILRFSSIVSGPALAQMLAACNTKIAYLNSWFGIADLFVRAILCNFCINIAMLMVYNGKLTNDFTKCTIMVVAVFVFTFCGFEHSVADSAMFLILGTHGLVNAWKAVLVIIVAILGNLVGGGILIGLNFATMNDERGIGIDKTGIGAEA